MGLSRRHQVTSTLMFYKNVPSVLQFKKNAPTSSGGESLINLPPRTLSCATVHTKIHKKSTFCHTMLTAAYSAMA